MSGLRHMQRGVFALTLAILLALQLGPVATAAFNSGMPRAEMSRADGMTTLVECDIVTYVVGLLVVALITYLWSLIFDVAGVVDWQLAFTLALAVGDSGAVDQYTGG